MPEFIKNLDKRWVAVLFVIIAALTIFTWFTYKSPDKQVVSIDPPVVIETPLVTPEPVKPVEEIKPEPKVEETVKPVDPIVETASPIIEQINKIRKENKLPALKENKPLKEAATAAAKKLVVVGESTGRPTTVKLDDTLSVVRANGLNPDILYQIPAYGHLDFSLVLKSVMRSPSQKAMLLNKDVTEVGVAELVENGKKWKRYYIILLAREK